MVPLISGVLSASCDTEKEYEVNALDVLNRRNGAKQKKTSILENSEHVNYFYMFVYF